MSALKSRVSFLLNWYTNPYHAPIVVAQQLGFYAQLELLRGETVFLRIDQLAGLGCCCFCSIQFIVPEQTLQKTELVQSFLKAIH